jgi:hypothetical protein
MRVLLLEAEWLDWGGGEMEGERGGDGKRGTAMVGKGDGNERDGVEVETV